MRSSYLPGKPSLGGPFASKCGPNPDDPNSTAASERLQEVAEILALGLIRLQARKSTPISADRGEVHLDCTGDQSGHGPSNSLERGG